MKIYVTSAGSENRNKNLVMFATATVQPSSFSNMQCVPAPLPFMTTSILKYDGIKGKNRYLLFTYSAIIKLVLW